MGENNAGNTVNPGYFGPGVIGPEVYAAEQAVVSAGGDIFGPGVTGLDKAVNKPGPGVTEQGPTEQAPVQGPAEPSLSIPKLTAALKENPALVDKLLEAELARPAGPRKGALEALFGAEQHHEGGPRDAVLDRIVAAEKLLG